MINQRLALISTLIHCLAIIVIKSESTNASPIFSTVKRSLKFDVKKDPHSSYYHDQDIFDLDTLAGIGLGKRSQTDQIARFEPRQPNIDNNRFGFLTNFQPVESHPVEQFNERSVMQNYGGLDQLNRQPSMVFRFRGSEQRIPSGD